MLHIYVHIIDDIIFLNIIIYMYSELKKIFVCGYARGIGACCTVEHTASSIRESHGNRNEIKKY